MRERSTGEKVFLLLVWFVWAAAVITYLSFMLGFWQEFERLPSGTGELWNWVFGWVEP